MGDETDETDEDEDDDDDDDSGTTPTKLDFLTWSRRTPVAERNVDSKRARGT